MAESKINGQEAQLRPSTLFLVNKKSDAFGIKLVTAFGNIRRRRFFIFFCWLQT